MVRKPLGAMLTLECGHARQALSNAFASTDVVYCRTCKRESVVTGRDDVTRPTRSRGTIDPKATPPF